jgi:hypothetical protein
MNGEEKEISDGTLSFLWDKWKTSNAHVYDRYNRFWALQIAVTGWVLFVLRNGITPQHISSSEVISCIALLVLVPLVGLYVVRLMTADVTVRNSYNPEIITALIERKILSIPDSEKELERESWIPTDYSHKWNNWHAAPTAVWSLESSVDTMRGTTTTMNVVYILCFVDLSFCILLVFLNFF